MDFSAVCLHLARHTITDLGQVQDFSHFRTHLGGIPIDRLFAHKDQIEIRNRLLDRRSQGQCGGPGVCTGKFPVTDQNPLVRAQFQCPDKHLGGLGRSHGEGSDMNIFQCGFQFDRMVQCIFAKWIENGGNPIPNQRTGFRVYLNI